MIGGMKEKTLVDQLQDMLAGVWGKPQKVDDVGRMMVEKLSTHPTTCDVEWTWDADEAGARLTVYPVGLRGAEVVREKRAAAAVRHCARLDDRRGYGPTPFEALAALARTAP